MNTTHDDFPHPVPPLAFLRWKENYFFILIDAKHDAFGIAHLNFEPGFARARFSCNLSVRGKLYQYASQTKLPAKFEMAHELGDGAIKLVIEQSHGRFRLEFRGDEIDFDLLFEKRFASFDFAACKYAAPEIPSFKELMTLGTNLPFEHLQQAMRVSGTLTLKDSGTSLSIDGYGYRDHSWCMRSDNLVAEHTWCGLNFDDKAFGVMTIETLWRRGLIGKEGYVVDAEGARALRSIEVRKIGDGPDGLPAQIVHQLRDVYGREYTIESNVSQRFAHVPLMAESPDGPVFYAIVENFCRSRLLQTGQEGVSLVELGESRSTA